MITQVTKLLRNCSISSTAYGSTVTPFSSSIGLIPVRFRWWATRPPVLRRFGYEDKMEFRGLLPRIPGLKKPLPIPPYCPKDNWSEKKALFGQNDYIDILGDGSLHPTQITYGVPGWLRGFRGNEYQMLLRKRKFFGRALAANNPDSHNDLQKRIRYLNKVLNWRRRFHFNNAKEIRK